MKKILLIGNKPVENDISERLRGFDFVVRVNRTTNWDKTRTAQTDLWIADVFNKRILPAYLAVPQDFRESVSAALCFRENANNILLNDIACVICEKPLSIVSFDSINIGKYLPSYKNFQTCGYRCSNTVWTLIRLLEKHPQDEITITAADVYDRSYLAANKWHENIYKEEEHMMQTLIRQGRIKTI